MHCSLDVELSIKGLDQVGRIKNSCIYGLYSSLRSRRISTKKKKKKKKAFLQALEIFQDRLSYTSAILFVPKFERYCFLGLC